MHYRANVCVIDDELAMGQIVPTDETHERLDESRLVLDFFLTSEGDWKVTRFYNPRTQDRGMAPSCFVPDEKIVEALNTAHLIAQQAQHGVAGHNFEMESE